MTKSFSIYASRVCTAAYRGIVARLRCRATITPKREPPGSLLSDNEFVAEPKWKARRRALTASAVMSIHDWIGITGNVIVGRRNEKSDDTRVARARTSAALHHNGGENDERKRRVDVHLTSEGRRRDPAGVLAHAAHPLERDILHGVLAVFRGHHADRPLLRHHLVVLVA